MYPFLVQPAKPSLSARTTDPSSEDKIFATEFQETNDLEKICNLKFALSTLKILSVVSKGSSSTIENIFIFLPKTVGSTSRSI